MFDMKKISDDFSASTVFARARIDDDFPIPGLSDSAGLGRGELSREGLALASPLIWEMYAQCADTEISHCCHRL